jgi:uncharacterized protein YcfL
MKNNRMVLAVRPSAVLMPFMPARRRLLRCLQSIVCLLFIVPLGVPLLAVASGPGVDDTKIEYYEPMTNIEVTSLSSATHGQGIAVAIAFKNSSSQSKSIYYRIVWLDQKGNAVSGRVPWSGLAIGGNSSQSISLTTDDPSVSSYRIQLSLGRNF